MDQNTILAEQEVQSFSYDLLYPITTPDGRNITKVTFKRRPTGAQLRDATHKFRILEERELHIMAFCLMLKMDDLDLMDALDINEIQQVYFRFLHQRKDGQ